MKRPKPLARQGKAKPLAPQARKNLRRNLLASVIILLVFLCLAGVLFVQPAWFLRLPMFCRIPIAIAFLAAATWLHFMTRAIIRAN